MKKLLNLSGKAEIKRIKSKSIRKFWAAILLAFMFMLALPRPVFAYPQITDASLTFEGVTVPDDANFFVVSPGATISASVQVTGTGDAYWNDWKSTSWRIGTSTSEGGWTCVDTPDYTDGSTHTETFDITAPATPGKYNLYIRTWTSNGCYLPNQYSDMDSGSLLNSIVVVGTADLIESYGANCTTQQDNFGGGENVCMEASGLESGHWQIRWTDPDGPSVRSVEADVSDGEYSDSWSPNPCNDGTWIVELRNGKWNSVAHAYIYDTVDVDTFNLSCAPAFGSFQADCVTPDDGFYLGDTVCMKGTGLPDRIWRMKWYPPDGSDPLTTPKVNTSGVVSYQYSPDPCVQGTWSVELQSSLLGILAWKEYLTDTFNFTCGACTPPTVTTNPSNQNIIYGQDASFTVAGTNVTSVQWQINDGSGWVDITGATSTTLHIIQPAVSLSGNQYRAVLTGDCEPAATSAAATLTVIADPFVALSDLTSSLNPSIYGDTVTFTAVASTSGGAPVGKVNFYELIPNMYGFTPTLLGWDEDADSLGDNLYAYTFSTSTLAIGDHYILVGYEVGNQASTESAGPLNQTVVAQVWPTVTITSGPPETSYSRQATFEFSSDTGGTAFECSLNEGNISSFEDLTWAACSSPQTYSDLSYGGTYTFVVKVQGAPIAATTMAWHQWFIAVPSVSITGGPLEYTDSTEATLTFTSDPTGVDLECYLVAQEYGTQDAVILEDWAPCSSPRTLTGLSHGYAYYFEVKPVGAAEYYAAMRQWTVTKLTLTASPNPSESGSNVTFTATLWDDSETAPGGIVTFAELFYSWPNVVTPVPLGQVSDPPISGTGSYDYAYSTSALTIGSHDIIAFYTEEGSSITSLPLTQEVIEVIAQAPVITTQPTNHTICAGSSVSFVAAASGTPAPTVRWQVSNDSGSTWNDISGATMATYAFTAGASDNGKQYHAVFTNSAGSATSSAAILTVNTAPVVTTQPTNQTVTYGAPSATFSVAASGTALSVQWHRSTNGTTWELVSGATTSNLTIAKPTVLMSGNQYRAEFSNVCGIATSSAATLTVNKAPVTATAGDYSGTYDGTAHSPSTCTVTGTYTGYLSCTNDPASVGPDVGSGSVMPVIVLNGETATNFSVTSQNGSWEITPAAVTITAGGYSSIYDGVSHSPSSCEVKGDYTGDLSCMNNPLSVGPDVGSGSVEPVLVLNGETATNFAITSQNVSWSITPAPVTATAGDYDGTYDGAAHSPSDCAVTGAYTGDLSCTNDSASVGPDVGSGTISPVVNGTGLTNYTIDNVNGSWEITPAAVKITAGDYRGIYDGVSHSPSACVVTGDYTGDLSCTNDPASVGPDVGSENISPVVNGTGLDNYTIISVNGSWEITPAAVTITAGDYSGSYDGVTHSPSECVVTGDYTGDLSCTNDPTSVGPDVGSENISPVVNGTGLDNYTITSVDGSWEITPAAVAATAGSYNGVYDGAGHSPSACAVTGVYKGDLSCTNDPASVGPDVDSGSISPVVIGTGLSNYAITNFNGSWEIRPAAVTITAGTYSVTYDGTAHSPSNCAVTGAYKGDLSCTNDPASVGPDVGSGIVVPVLILNGETETNFTVTSENGSWSIAPAPVTIIAGDYSSTYDGVTHSPSNCAVTGDYKGDLSCTNDPVSVGPDVGSGSVEPVLVLNGETATNFAVISQNGSWSIAPAPVTITAGGYSGTYDGTAHSPLDCGVTGTYTGDLTCTNDPASVGPDVGTGSVLPVLVLNSETETNFTVTSENGTWSITPAAVTITAGVYSGTYDGAAHSPSDCAVTGAYTGNLSCTNDPASVGPDVNSGSVVPVLALNGEVETNFIVTSQNGSWEIIPAILTVTADDQTAQYSDASPAPLTFQYDGFVAGEDASVIDIEPTCSTTRLISDPAGGYSIICSGGGDNNYDFKYIEGTFTVTHEDARILLDNEVAFLVDAPGEDINTLILYADVLEVNPDVGYGPAAGDIEKAEVTMILTPVGIGGTLTGICEKFQDNALTGYDQINTYKCTFTTVEVNTYLVEASVVGGYYVSGTAEDVLVVYDPSLGFTTAGGWFYWPGTNDKTNFGYTMKYNKPRNKVQGSLLLIRHTDEGNYRIKSNALYGLALGEYMEDGLYIGWASFSGKCTYQEPDWLEPEGNHVFLVYVEDHNDPGAGFDKFWIDVDDDDGYLSLGPDAIDNLVILDGGNIVAPHTPN